MREHCGLPGAVKKKFDALTSDRLFSGVNRLTALLEPEHLRAIVEMDSEVPQGLGPEQELIQAFIALNKSVCPEGDFRDSESGVSTHRR